MAAYTTIDDPSAHFQTALYAGNDTTDHNITNDGNSNLQPDLVWIKQRTSDNPHMLQDSSRGFAGNGEVNVLQSNSTGAEATNGAFESFNTNGFGVGGTNVASGAYNLDGSTYVAWQWKANGGTTASNTDGDLTTTVQANTTAGFSIITYTGLDPIEPLDIGHGLGSVPEFWIIKSREIGAKQWGTYHHKMHATLPQNYYLTLHTTNAASAASSWWRNEAPTSTVIKTGEQDDVNRANSAYVCYAFTGIQGFSKFGKYTSNDNIDGPFIFLGFKPAFVMIKQYDAAGNNWHIYDNKREGYNGGNDYLEPNNTTAEQSDVHLDILSNGFKIRTTGNDLNEGSYNYIYMAFAEAPFVNSNGVPNNAR